MSADQVPREWWLHILEERDAACIRIRKLETVLRNIEDHCRYRNDITGAQLAQDALFSIENVEKPGKVSRLCTCTNDRQPGQRHMKTCSQSDRAGVK